MNKLNKLNNTAMDLAARNEHAEVVRRGYRITHETYIFKHVCFFLHITK